MIWDAALLPGDPYPGAEPGRVLGAVFNPYPAEACGQVVACGEGAVIVLELESADGTTLKGPGLSEPVLEGRVFSDE